VTQANKDLIRRMEDRIFNKRDLGAIEDFISPSYVLRTAADGAPSGLDGVRGAMAAYLAGFSDLHVEVDQLLADGDKVVALLTYSGTNDGDLFGVSATGRRVSVRQLAVYRVADGKVVEEWEVSDQLGLMQQLGVVPAQ
jgi:predicted ester cyclase